MGIGATTLVLSIIFALALVVAALLTGYGSGVTTLALLILFFGSLLTLSLGLLGVYLATILDEVRQRPLYTIEDLT
jgi:dolichol-phosphate mannosyltransferase